MEVGGLDIELCLDALSFFPGKGRGFLAAAADHPPARRSGHPARHRSSHLINVKGTLLNSKRITRPLDGTVFHTDGKIVTDMPLMECAEWPLISQPVGPSPAA